MKDEARQAALDAIMDRAGEAPDVIAVAAADAAVMAVLQKIVGEMPMSNIDRAHVYVRSLLAEFSAPEGRPEPATPPGQISPFAGVVESSARVPDVDGVKARLKDYADGFHSGVCASGPAAPVTPEPPPPEMSADALRRRAARNTAWPGAPYYQSASEARPTTLTDVVWLAMTDNERYAEYLRVTGQRDVRWPAELTNAQRAALGQIARCAKADWMELSTASDPHDEYEAMSVAVAISLPSVLGSATDSSQRSELMNGQERSAEKHTPESAPSAPEGRTLKDYRPQHDGDCASVEYCRVCSLNKNCAGHVERCGPTPPCSCGLDALLAVSHG